MSAGGFSLLMFVVVTFATTCQHEGKTEQGEQHGESHNHFCCFSSSGVVRAKDGVRPVSTSRFCPASSASRFVSSKLSTACRYFSCNSTYVAIGTAPSR